VSHNSIYGSLLPKYERQTRLLLTHGAQQGQIRDGANLLWQNPSVSQGLATARPTISGSGPGRCRPLCTLGRKQGFDVCLDIFQVILELINPLVLSGFAGLDLCLELRSHAPHLRPQKASQPKDGGQRSTGLDPVCKHGWGNCHGHSGVDERIPRRAGPHVMASVIKGWPGNWG